MRISGVLCSSGSVSTCSASVLLARGSSSTSRAAGVDGVVEAEVAVGEEDVPATSRPPAPRFSSFIFSLISEWPTFHMMARRRARAISSYSAWLHLTSLTKVAPGRLLQDVAREQDHQLVAPDDAPLAVDDADAVGVAVERDAHLGAGLAAPARSVGDVLGDGGIGVVVGEAPVRLAVERARPRSPGAQDRQRSARPPMPLPASTTTLNAARPELDALGDVVDVGGRIVALSRPCPARGAGSEVARSRRARAAPGSRRRGWCCAAQDLEAVVLGRVVAAGDLHAAVGCRGGTPRSRGPASPRTPTSMTSSPSRAGPRTSAACRRGEESAAVAAQRDAAAPARRGARRWLAQVGHELVGRGRGRRCRGCRTHGRRGHWATKGRSSKG